MDKYFQECATGLMSKDDYNKLKEAAEKGVILKKDGDDKEKDKPKKKKKKKQTSNLSFGDDIDEMEEVSPRLIKKKNPNVNTAFLAKEEWLTKETKAKLAEEAEERAEAALRIKEIEEQKSLTIKFAMTLRPLHAEKLETYQTGGGEEMVVEDKPPRFFRDQKVTCTYGTKVMDFVVMAQKELNRRNSKAAASSNLLLVVGNFIVPDHLNFHELSVIKYIEGDPIFKLGLGSEEECPVQVMERSWYEASRFHYPQSSWQTYQNSKTYPNPLKNKLFQAVGSQDEIDQWNKSQGVEEGFVYKDSAHRSNWQR